MVTLLFFYLFHLTFIHSVRLTPTAYLPTFAAGNTSL